MHTPPLVYSFITDFIDEIYPIPQRIFKVFKEIGLPTAVPISRWNFILHLYIAIGMLFLLQLEICEMMV